MVTDGHCWMPCMGCFVATFKAGSRSRLMKGRDDMTWTITDTLDGEVTGKTLEFQGDFPSSMLVDQRECPELQVARVVE